MSKPSPSPIQKELNSYEIAAIEYLAAIDSQLIQSERHLEARLKSIPDAWRQYRIAQTAIAKALDALYATVPTKVLLHMQRLAKNGEVIIRQKSITKTNEAQLVPEDVLKLLINLAMESQCAICLKDSKEAKRCKLRKGLMLIAPPDKVNESGCSYSDVAMQNNLGEYI